MSVNLNSELNIALENLAEQEKQLSILSILTDPIATLDQWQKVASAAQTVADYTMDKLRATIKERVVIGLNPPLENEIKILAQDEELAHAKACASWAEVQKQKDLLSRMDFTEQLNDKGDSVWAEVQRQRTVLPTMSFYKRLIYPIVAICSSRPYRYI